MDTKQLIKKANNIPSLGCGGKAIKGYLMFLSNSIDDNHDIVEVGPWLGSTTAFLAVGLQSKKNINIHSYDRWIADEIYRFRAKKYHNIDFKENEDLLPYFIENIKPFGIKPYIYKTDFLNIKRYNGKKIAIAIHDAGCRMDIANNFMKVFSDNFIPNKTIVLMMDYYFYERKDPIFKTQYLMMKKNRSSFEFLGKIGNSKTAAFKYMGGKIQYLNEADYVI